MNLRWLRALRSVMTVGTVTEAAEHLKVTQPAVSRMIASLEEELGFKLFVRNRGRLVATSEGESFYRESERLLAGVDEILSIARDIRTGQGGRLRLVAMASIAAGLLPEAVEAFLAEYPEVRISMEIRARRDVERWVAGQQFDLGIEMLPIEHPAVVYREFLSTMAMCVLPAGHRLAARATVRASDLVDEPLVLLSHQSLLRYRVDQHFAALALVPQVSVETTSMFSACQMAAHGAGIAIADQFAVAALEGANVVTRPLDPPLPLRYGVVFPTNRPTSAVAERFAEIATERARDIVHRVSSA